MEEKKRMEDSSSSLKEEYLDEDSDDGFLYEEISVEEDGTSSGDENFTTAIHNQSQNVVATSHPNHLATDSSAAHCEVIEDFVCNFLASNGMLETLDTFQAEWYKLYKTNKQESMAACELPDVYAQNRLLEASVLQLRKELKEHKETARLTKEKCVRVQKERDYHRMHHRRVLQEKETMSAELKLLKTQYTNTGPVIATLKQKCENMAREKTLMSLERDRYRSEAEFLNSTLVSVSGPEQPKATPPTPTTTFGATPTALKAEKSKYMLELPAEPGVNPYEEMDKWPVSTHFSRTGGYQPSQSFKAHSCAVTDVEVHPNKPVLATASDDHTWKLWTLSGGERLITGEGHNDWVSCVRFDHQGTSLATSSGDGTIKIWDLVKTQCTVTLSEHQQPVWGVAWHWSDSLLASAAMDHTIKLWQPQQRASSVTTLRGHSDSVNCVSFLPYSNSFASCSADKSISLWDVRAGYCVHTFYGHRHAIYTVQPSYQGWELFSGDCFGNVLCWDMRSKGCVRAWNVGPLAVNKVTVDSAKSLLACASDARVVILIDLREQLQSQETSASLEHPKEWRLQHHQDRVLGVAYTTQADGLVSTDYEGVVTVWQ